MGLRNLDRWVRSLREDVASLEVPRDLEERFGRYRKDPVGFVREVISAEPQPYQAEILAACTTSPRVAVRSGHGVGKTTLLSWVLLWFLLTRPFSRVLILAPAYERQVGRYLLPEVRKWAREAPERLPIQVLRGEVRVRGFENEWFALGVQASDSSLVEGAHAESLCVLADEAKAIPSEVIAALHGTQTDVGGDRLYVLASVPGGPSGPFYDACRNESGVWETFHVSAEDSALVSDRWVSERQEEWGRGSPLFQSRVLGEFPEEDEGTLYRLSDLEGAVERTVVEGWSPETVSLGVDVARFGADRSAIAVWRSDGEVSVLDSVETRQGMDVMSVAAWVASEINRSGADRVRVDEIGIGSGVVDRLKQLDHGVQGVNVSRSARRPDLHANLRAELHWRFREALERGRVSLPDHPRLVAELSAARFGYTSSGQVQIEEKAEIKKRVGRSPDLADAVVLGWPRRTRPKVRLTWGS